MGGSNSWSASPLNYFVRAKTHFQINDLVTSLARETDLETKRLV